MNLNRNYRYLFLIMLGIGIVGVVFFFPMQINSRYTCLYHRLIQPDNLSVIKHKMPGYSGDSLADPCHPQSNNMASNQSNINHEKSVTEFHTSDLLNRYIHGYAWFWWGSILLLAFAFYLGKQQKQSGNTKL
jgi:hypothetical protein